MSVTTIFMAEMFRDYHIYGSDILNYCRIKLNMMVAVHLYCMKLRKKQFKMYVY